MKVCVIGCGAVARRAHIPAFQSIPGVDVISVVDSDGELAKKVSREYRIKKYYTDYKEALVDKEVELVSICTPSPTHAEIVIQACKMGKNVLVEKPLATDVEQGKTAVKASKDNDVKLCVLFSYRMVPAVQEARRRIMHGQIGRVVSMVGTAHTPFPVSWTRSTWLYDRWGALDDFGPHMIDLLLWMNPSRLEAVSALGGDFTNNFGFISHLQVGLKFRDTSVAVADISWLADSFIISVDAHGTAGRISCDVRNDHNTETHGQIPSPIDDLASTTRKTLRMVKSVLSGEYFRGGIGHHSQIIREYIHSIERETDPPISGEEALLVTAASIAAKQSLRTGRAIFIDKHL